eukprot:CAMPEP_0176485550 /NCGR_PEP_ID=MMETSP0200_2-20121128/5096_1 /TAXON_ID=947934 /ORGANISM="Chaetoceros sp., Strain GSL56" /LENGTH=141 /DNA_ID=CAMNT_0017882195 /DNA_START=33 /DNA_END=455 /DNA_ORIENTATION=-
MDHDDPHESWNLPADNNETRSRTTADADADADADTEVDFQVIGACWGRTGTHSLKNALEILGYECYHMKEVISHGENHTRFWQRVAKNQSQAEIDINFNEVFIMNNNSKSKNFTASCDFPSAVFWKEQLKQYPKAKVILGW